MLNIYVCAKKNHHYWLSYIILIMIVAYIYCLHILFNIIIINYWLINYYYQLCISSKTKIFVLAFSMFFEMMLLCENKKNNKNNKNTKIIITWMRNEKYVLKTFVDFFIAYLLNKISKLIVTYFILLHLGCIKS